jgi:hypothetical protein
MSEEKPLADLLQPICRYISDVLASDATPSEKHIARTIMHLLPLDAAIATAPVAQPVAFINASALEWLAEHPNGVITTQVSMRPGGDRVAVCVAHGITGDAS